MFLQQEQPYAACMQLSIKSSVMVSEIFTCTCNMLKLKLWKLFPF